MSVRDKLSWFMRRIDPFSRDEEMREDRKELDREIVKTKMHLASLQRTLKKLEAKPDPIADLLKSQPE